MDNVVEIIVAILVGLGISIPAVASLIKSVRQNVKEKRWDLLTKKAIDFMITAEENFRTGAVKRDFVLSMLKRAAEQESLPFDEDKVGAMIDAMVELSKQINVPKETSVLSDGE